MAKKSLESVVEEPEPPEEGGWVRPFEFEAQ